MSSINELLILADGKPCVDVDISKRIQEIMATERVVKAFLVDPADQSITIVHIERENVCFPSRDLAGGHDFFGYIQESAIRRLLSLTRHDLYSRVLLNRIDSVTQLVAIASKISAVEHARHTPGVTTKFDNAVIEGRFIVVRKFEVVKDITDREISGHTDVTDADMLFIQEKVLFL